MSVILYNISLRIYRIGILVASFFNEKAKAWLQGRRNIFKRIKNEVKTNQKLVWFHCASLGEFEQGRPVIEAFKDKFPEYNVFLTFFSPSGYEARKNYSKADYVYYLPMDSKRNAKKLISLIRPEMVFFVKYEFWYHYLKTLHENNIPVYLISGIFRKGQVFFRNYGGWYKEFLEYFTYLFVQDEQSKALLNKNGFSNVMVSGDTRFDRVLNISSSMEVYDEIETFKNKELLIIGGSTWPKDEELLIHYINHSLDNIKWIIAPHEVSKSHVDDILYNLTKPAIRYSQTENSDLTEFNVLIIDNIGMLSCLYRYAEIAYIGGGFGKGIHNILEAAVFSIPVVFGPNYKKFSEAVQLKKINGAFVIHHYREFKSIMDKLIYNRQYRKSCGNIAGSYVTNNIGGTDKIISHISRHS